uniref:Capsid protein n=1 Tax=Cressdnaviricota sp. TaxID=2748378 RepID=A0A4D6J044_9VIRU|nr:capsid protein [Cressdnaviricota sp.]
MATNYVTAKYQEIYDLGTQAGKTTILGIHTPDDGNVYNMLSGFFDQFRKYKYKGCSVSMVPAAQLPADPLQVSFEAGELTCDPRDLLNPILFHGCHGEELNEILDNIYYKGSNATGAVHEGVTDTALAESSYYAALSDPSFRKYGIQSGAKVNLKPMVHPVALTNPMIPSDSSWTYAYKMTMDGHQTTVTGSYNGLDVGNIRPDGTIEDPSFMLPTELTGTGFPAVTVPLVQNNAMFTNGLRPLGWLPTWQFAPVDEKSTSQEQLNISKLNIRTARLPRLYMGFFILPPSYTQEMYFRLIITHYFEFKDFSTALTRHTVNTLNPDRYVYNETIPEPTVSGQSTSLSVVDGSIAQTSEGVY